MTDKQDELLLLLQNEYLPKVYGFSYMKLNQAHDAEELASEIILQIVKYIRHGGIIDNMNAFVWKVSNNTLCKMLRRKKYGSTMYLTELIPSGDNIEDDIIRNEDIMSIRRELSLLSEKYRQVIILHYFDGRTCEEISAIVGKSSGTVKWWLHEARNYIKEGINNMRQYGEKSYNPSVLSMSCQCNPGSNMEPMSCAKRKSAQNILLAAYKSPMSVQELSLELGIAVPYIEDEAEYLTKQQLMKKSGDKYQTDFVILPGRNLGIADRIYESCIPKYYQKLINLLESVKETLISKPFNPAGFSWERLLWMYLHLFTDINLCKFKREVCKVVEYNDVPDRPNGGKWIALGWENSFPAEPIKSKYKEYQVYDGPVHKADFDVAQGFFHYWSGLDSSVFFDIPDGVFSVCRDIIKGVKQADKLTEEDKLLFCHAIEKSLFIKTDDGFKLNYCFIGAEQMKFIRSVCSDFYDTASGYFKRAYDIVIAEYEKKVPKHLHWQMGNLLSNHLNHFVNGSIYEACNEGILSTPDDENKAWLSLFATEWNK